MSMRPSRAAAGFGQRRRLLFVVALASLALLATDPGVARADIAVVGVNPRTAKPGQEVELTVGCGACKAAYITNGPAHPPRDFPAFLVPLARAPQAGPCPDGRSGLCAPTSLGPPSRPPFVALGRARPTFRERALARIPRPRYRLRFGVPSVAPGRYALVLYCAVCVDGPQGSLITDPHNPSYGLRVLASRPAGSSEPVRLLGVVLLLLEAILP
jgi:hypothetical protein